MRGQDVGCEVEEDLLVGEELETALAGSGQEVREAAGLVEHEEALFFAALELLHLLVGHALDALGVELALLDFLGLGAAYSF